jgi:2-dehydropantoate 2-reductase
MTAGSNERFTIVGAGAVGGILGGALIDAGHSVTFVEVDEAHVQAVRDRGLALSGAREMTVRPEIVTPAEVQGALTSVLLAVKARHTDEAIRRIAPHLAPDGFVVSLQNGLEEYKIARVVGKERTIGAFLTFGGHYAAPGSIVYGGPGSFRIGELDGRPSERTRRLQEAFSALQPVEVTDNIFGYLWGKMALGAVYFATALVSADVPDLLEDDSNRQLFANIAAEVVSVAEAEGVRVEDFDGFDPKTFRFGSLLDPERVAAAWQAQIAYWNRHSQRRTGVWRDLAIHKRKTEVDELIGAVASHANVKHIEIPRVRRIIDLVHEVETGRRELSHHNLEDLKAIDVRELTQTSG